MTGTKDMTRYMMRHLCCFVAIVVTLKMVTICNCQKQNCCENLKLQIASLEKKLYKLETKLTSPMSDHIDQSCKADSFKKGCYRIAKYDGATWQLFWWYKPNRSWPKYVSDVLEDEYGMCNSKASYCFGRLPSHLKENKAEIMTVDSAGTIYRWKFNSRNSVSHAAWEAFHGGLAVEQIRGDPWVPKVIQGKRPKDQQVSFLYRMVNGVKSLLLGSGYCDCMSTISIGHAMCRNVFNQQYKDNVFGVDLLYDKACQTPHEKQGLYILFRDDDDCIGVKCPKGTKCQDGIESYQCV